MIDAKQFMNAQYSEPNSTKRTPIPPGEYKAIVDKVELETFPGKKDTSKVYLKCNATLNLDEPTLRTQLEREKVVIVHGFLVDLNDAGAIDFSKERNVTLGKFREAIGMNTPGTPWSFPMFEGKVLRVKVAHEMYEGEPQARVVAVAKL